VEREKNNVAQILEKASKSDPEIEKKKLGLKRASVEGQLGGEEGEGEGQEVDFWDRRIKEFNEALFTEHDFRLKLSTIKGPQAYTQEVWRARHALYDIVDERVDAILRLLDDNLAEVVKSVQQARLSLFQEVCAETSSMCSVMPDEPISLASIDLGSDGSPLTGIGAFAKRLRQASDNGSDSKSVAPTSPMSRSLALTLKLVPSSPGAEESRKARTHNLIYGTKGKQRGGPSMLGAGPQDATIRKPEPISTTSYTELHSDRVKKMTVSHTCQDTGKHIGHVAEDLSLKQLRELMQLVYESKRQYDQQCRAQQYPTATMEQHLYAYLRQRYHLKAAIQDWTAAIFKAIQKFAKRENEVAVFGKILQNTVAESFPTVQEDVQKTAHQMLMSGLNERYPNRGQTELAEVYRARCGNGFPLKECAQVVRYMYNESDADKLCVKMQYCAANPTIDLANELAPDAVRHKDFLQVLLSFQMSLTESFLSEFVQIFQGIDEDKDGILSHADLEELVRQVGYIEGQDGNEMNDPTGVLFEAKNTTYGSVRKLQQGATFSECVDLFTGLISARWGMLNPL